MTEIAQSEDGVAARGARPRERDPAVVAAAVAAFAAEMMRRGGDYVEGVDEDVLREDLASVMPIYDTDGMELAQAMSRRFGYSLDAGFVELMSGWGEASSEAREAAVRAWVAATKPEAPFSGVARATVAGDRHRDAPVPGTAYRTPQRDVLASCLFVPDAKRETYVTDGAFSGGRIMDWEDVAVTGPATDADRAAFHAMHEAEARSQRQAAYHRQRWERDAAFRDSVDAAAVALRDVPDADLAAAFDAAATAMAGPGFDPFSEVAARAAASLRLQQERVARKAFASAG